MPIQILDGTIADTAARALLRLVPGGAAGSYGSVSQNVSAKCQSQRFPRGRRRRALSNEALSPSRSKTVAAAVLKTSEECSVTPAVNCVAAAAVWAQSRGFSLTTHASVSYALD